MNAKTVSRTRADVHRALVRLGPVIEGSLYSLRRGGQIRWQLTDRPTATTRTLYVPASRAQEVRQWTANWKKAKGLLKELSEISRAEIRAATGPGDGRPARRRTPEV